MDELSDDDRRSNLCADIVSLTRLEPGLAHLFRQPLGHWVAVETLYRLSGQVGRTDFPTLAACWLPSPPGTTDCVLVVFCDVDSLWSMVAFYYAFEKVLNAHSV
jgi:hypothetical protein